MTTAAEAPPALTPKAPARPRKAPKAAGPARARRSVADLSAQLAALRQRQLREAHAAAMAQAEALRETLTQLSAEPDCPLPRESVAAVLYVIEKAEADWRRTTWAPAGSAE